MKDRYHRRMVAFAAVPYALCLGTSHHHFATYRDRFRATVRRQPVEGGHVPEVVFAFGNIHVMTQIRQIAWRVIRYRTQPGASDHG